MTSSKPNQMHVFHYTEADWSESFINSLADIKMPTGDEVMWINIDNVYNAPLIEQLGSQFKIHPLHIEDIINLKQRPKCEAAETYLYITFHMLRWHKGVAQADKEQVSVLVGPNFVISIQEKPGDVFDQVRERIRKGKTKLRRSKSDYLAYALIDAAVDAYFNVIESSHEVVNQIQETLLVKQKHEKAPHQILKSRQHIIEIRRSISPMQQLIDTLLNGDTPFIEDSTRFYLRDAWDHVTRLKDDIDSLGSTLDNITDTYFYFSNQRLSEIMKVFTLFTAVFSPLTLIVSIYGTNFKYIPELEWRYGYFAMWGVVIVVGFSMWYYFKKRRWL